MYELKSPAEKIQALFYKALKPVAGAGFKPSDIGVIFDGTALTIDLRRVSEVASHLPTSIGLADGLRMHAGTPAVFKVRGDVSRLQNFPVQTLQSDIAGSLIWDPSALAIAQTLEKASAIRGPSV